MLNTQPDIYAELRQPIVSNLPPHTAHFVPAVYTYLRQSDSSGRKLPPPDIFQMKMNWVHPSVHRQSMSCYVEHAAFNRQFRKAFGPSFATVIGYRLESVRTPPVSDISDGSGIDGR